MIIFRILKLPPPKKKNNIVPSGSIKRKIVSRASGHSPSVHNPESEYDLFSPDYINPVRKLKKTVKRDRSSEYELFPPENITPSRRLRKKPMIDYQIYK